MAAASPGARLRPRERLRAAADYRRVFRRGLRIDGPLFLLVAAENERGFPRLGLAAGKRAGGAVERNRAKRLLREAFRRTKPPEGRSIDLVFVPKPEMADHTQEEVEREYQERLRRLEARWARGSRPHPAPAR